jgi:hypothetical protein
MFPSLQVATPEAGSDFAPQPVIAVALSVKDTVPLSAAVLVTVAVKIGGDAT